MADRGYEEAFSALKAGVAKRIESLKGEMAAVRQEIEEKQKQEAILSRQIAELESAVSIFQRALNIGASPIPTNGFDLHKLRNQTVANSAVDIMRARGGHAKVTDILKQLTEAGKLAGYQSGYSTIKKTLDRDSRFQKRAPGEYELVASDGA